MRGSYIFIVLIEPFLAFDRFPLVARQLQSRHDGPTMTSKRQHTVRRLLSIVLLLFTIAFPTCGATNSTSFSSIIAMSPPPYEFVFAYSTGHVGTTAMGDGGVFGNPPNMLFLHEMQNGPVTLPKRNKFTTAAWSKSDYNGDYKWVKEVYMNFLRESKEGKEVLVDLGHNNLYFALALVEYLLAETTHRFIFVRVRRDRLESAISLSFDRPNHQYTDICASLWYRFCPYDRENDVILHPPSRDVWNAFSVFQKTLWVVDETEAQWNRLVAEHGGLNHTEVLWGSKWAGSFENATAHIGTLLGLNVTALQQSETTKYKENVHAGRDNQDAYAHLIAQQDIEYRRIMRQGLGQGLGQSQGPAVAGGVGGVNASSLIAYALLI